MFVFVSSVNFLMLAPPLPITSPILLLGILIYFNVRSDPETLNSKDSLRDLDKAVERQDVKLSDLSRDCLLYTSDAADD